MRIGNIVLALVIAVPVAAFAQSYEQPGMEGSTSRMTRGADIFAGIGGGNYTSDLGNVVGSGIAWTARVGVQPWKFVGGEVAYEGLNGSTGKVIVPGAVSTGESLTQHQVTVDARAGYPMQVADRALRPYVFAGLGYARLQAASALQNAGLDSQNLFAVPVGGGVSYQVYGPLALDGRFTYNILSGIDQPLAQGGDSWTALVNLGAQFGRR